LILNYVFWC